MNALESMIKKLSPLNIYNLNGESNVYAELAAYAAALDAHRASLDEAVRECFISTAETFGLEVREKVVGDIRSDCTKEQRREMLSTRASLGEKDFTCAGLERFMKSFGVQDYTVEEFAGAQSVTIAITGDYSNSAEAWIKNQIELIVPTHLEVNIYSGGPDWSKLDDKDYTFDAFDGRNYTWKQLNILR